MIDFLTKIVAAIVDDPKNIKIDFEQANGLSIYKIFVPESEVGKVIGKEGKVISSIRSLARLKFFKKQEKVLIKVEALV
ncbi:hypothetical protein COT64_01160 [Candidatus Shapirobacteria bacterium CG09_land_8_20_14_0_10_39_12]|uniref:RNA-binding protein KhpA n=1 Tax=Candidatus Shapirobacteria bacterium CG09_land_8_20_14_0_10_39_12 TaxID=1974885 RepID=A0A2H0WPZ2_9BACT|nr:MAG: hypothetical protein COT64_01160 [Candidatus Shapirobacteria bacterium CG09_land_8_20_14_0_10_39_12]